MKTKLNKFKKFEVKKTRNLIGKGCGCHGLGWDNWLCNGIEAFGDFLVGHDCHVDEDGNHIYG